MKHKTYLKEGVLRPPPPRIGFRVEMHGYSPIFQAQLKEKNRPITLKVWVLGRIAKMPKKGSKIFFVLNKHQCVSTCIFHGLFENLVFRSLALVTN